jgi:hypothetical protein
MERDRDLTMVETENYLILVPVILAAMLVFALGGPVTLLEAARPVFNWLVYTLTHVIR